MLNRRRDQRANPPADTPSFAGPHDLAPPAGDRMAGDPAIDAAVTEAIAAFKATQAAVVPQPAAKAPQPKVVPQAPKPPVPPIHIPPVSIPPVLIPPVLIPPVPISQMGGPRSPGQPRPHPYTGDRLPEGPPASVRYARSPDPQPSAAKPAPEDTLAAKPAPAQRATARGRRRRGATIRLTADKRPRLAAADHTPIVEPRLQAPVE